MENRNSPRTSGFLEPSLAVSSDGRHVAFVSPATNLTPPDTNDQTDIFVHDRETGKTTRVSVDSSGRQADNASFQPAISADGRFVAFLSLASNLAANGDAAIARVFVHDRDADENGVFDEECGGCRSTAWIDLGLPDERGLDTVESMALSGNGRVLAAAIGRDGPTPDDSVFDADVLVVDLRDGGVRRVSADRAGILSESEQGERFGGFLGSVDVTSAPALGFDGQVVAYVGNLWFSFPKLGWPVAIFVEDSNR